MSDKIADFGFRISDFESSSRFNNPQSAISNPKLNGFTLLEVLLAMAILAVMMTVIYVAFSTSANNVEQAEIRRDETDIARTLMARLSADIANAYIATNLNVPTFFTGKKEEIEGEAKDKKIRRDTVSLTTLTNWRKPDSKETELWEVGYFFKEKPDGKGYTLFRREKRELSNDVPPTEGGVEYELTDRVESLQFTFSEDGSKWTDNGWDSKTKTPKVVDIALTLDNGKMYSTRVDVGNSK